MASAGALPADERYGVPERILKYMFWTAWLQSFTGALGSSTVSSVGTVATADSAGPAGGNHSDVAPASAIRSSSA